MGEKNSKQSKLSAELTYEELQDLHVKTQIPIHELSQWYKRFYDFSHGKELDQKNFKKYFKELLPSSGGNSEDFCNLAFNVFDKDHTSLIDYEEIMIGFATLYKPDLDSRLNWMFQFYDQDSNGFIDQDELKGAIKAILRMKNHYVYSDDVDSILEQVHLNFSPQISLEEFLFVMKSNEKLREILCPPLD